MQCFLEIPHDVLHLDNWGTGTTRVWWECNDETYINGVLLTVDADYYMGYLIECVDRTTGIVTFHAIATFHGRNPHTGHQAHDSHLYEPDCGTFFDRTEAADRVTVSRWAVGMIYDMFEEYAELSAKALRRAAQE